LTLLPHAALTLADLIDLYTKLHLQVRVKTWKNVWASLRQPAMQHLQDRHVDTIEKREVVAVLDAIVAAGKPHAATNLLKSLRAAFNWASDRGDMTGNPCERVRQPAATTQRDRVLSDREIGRVLRACAHVPVPFGSMVRVLLHTGARRNEVAHMRWSELEGNIWTLPATRSKSGRANSLPLPPAVMAVLDAQARPANDEDGYVFSSTGGLKPSSDFTKRKRVLDEASGVTGWHLHDLRRTARSLMAKLGVDREVARRVVGHSVDQLDAIYDRHDYAEEKAAALDCLAAYLAALVLRD
jgi:integrase